MPNISYEAAQAVVEAALARADAIGSPSSVTVVDAGRNLVTFARQDGAILASIEVSSAKAYTASSLNMATSDLAAAVQPGAPLFGLAGSHGVPLVPFGGGRPITIDGELCGAVGVSGGSPDQDDDIAAAAVSATGGVAA